MSGVVCDVILRYDVYQNATVLFTFHLHLLLSGAPIGISSPITSPARSGFTVARRVPT